jgi:hypothetical protein
MGVFPSDGMNRPSYIGIRVPLSETTSADDVLAFFRDSAKQAIEERLEVNPLTFSGESGAIDMLNNMRGLRAVMEYRWFFSGPAEMCIVLATHRQFLIKQAMEWNDTRGSASNQVDTPSWVKAAQAAFGSSVSFSLVSREQFQKAYRFGDYYGEL